MLLFYCVEQGVALLTLAKLKLAFAFALCSKAYVLHSKTRARSSKA